jgi:Tfp pilus assembly PilM family ATPase
MKKISELLKVFQRGYNDVLGIDLAGSCTKAVRLKNINGTLTIVAADILPKITLAAAPSTPPPFQVPRPLQGRYVAMATSAPGAIAKLLTLPAHSDKSMDAHVNELMGISADSDYRVGYESIAENRSEIRILAAGFPDATARMLCQLFPAGIPAPCSIEIAGLAGMTAFTRGPGATHKSETVAAIDFGATSSYVAFFNKGILALIRKFDLGSDIILRKLQGSLGVDEEVALGILNDGSFDISHILRETMEGFLQQLTISWDFVERRENNPIARLYVTGGMSNLSSWSREIQGVTGKEPAIWNPLSIIPSLPNASPDRLKGQESRFAAAIGAAIAVGGER